MPTETAAQLIWSATVAARNCVEQGNLVRANAILATLQAVTGTSVVARLAQSNAASVQAMILAAA